MTSKPKATPELLVGRQASCSMIGVQGFHAIKASSLSLAFFEYRPEHDYDFYYCGCIGWD